MSDEKALLAAITAYPLDDAPRLVYADWLDEQGGAANAARAEFIRVQCELELLPADDPRYGSLERRAAKLLKERKKDWLKPLAKYKRDVEFSRGFPLPNLSSLTVDQLTKLTETSLRAAPLWRYSRGFGPDDIDAVLRWPMLHRITTFALYLGAKPKAGWAKRIAECDGLRNVTDLGFNYSPVSSASLKTVLDAWTGRRLRVLLLNNCPIGDAGIRLVARHPATTNLRRLYVHTTKITGAGMDAVAAGPNLDRLMMATFAHNRLGATGGEHLLRWKALGTIRELYLMNTKLPKRIADRLNEQLRERVKL